MERHRRQHTSCAWIVGKSLTITGQRCVWEALLARPRTAEVQVPCQPIVDSTQGELARAAECPEEGSEIPGKSREPTLLTSGVGLSVPSGFQLGLDGERPNTDGLGGWSMCARYLRWMFFARRNLLFWFRSRCRSVALRCRTNSKDVTWPGPSSMTARRIARGRTFLPSMRDRRTTELHFGSGEGGFRSRSKRHIPNVDGRIEGALAVYPGVTFPCGSAK
jgi:hypothetical protein